jgi:hypothetical protein
MLPKFNDYVRLQRSQIDPPDLQEMTKVVSRPQKGPRGPPRIPVLMKILRKAI